MAKLLKSDARQQMTVVVAPDSIAANRLEVNCADVLVTLQTHLQVAALPMTSGA